MFFGGIYDAGFRRLAQELSPSGPGGVEVPPTQEMIDHFYSRTNHHIELVRKYCARLEDRLPELEGLFERGFRHDSSKFEPEELLPYVWLTWRYKCKDDGVPCELPVGVEEAINEATEHHILINAHHPEFHQRKSEDVINEEDRDAPPDEAVNATRMETFDLAEMCFTGDTKISLLNGHEVALVDLIGKDPFWVYSCTPEGEVVPGLARDVRKTREVSELCEVALDNGSIIRCTLDHKFMMRDGSYREASSLSAGDSLMPLYRRLSKKFLDSEYEEVYHPKGRWQLTHRMVVNKILGGYKSFVKKSGTNAVVCHHKNFDDPNNKRNNDPANLELMTREQHAAVHSEEQEKTGGAVLRELWKDPDFRKRRLEASGSLGRVTGPKNITKFNKSEKHRIQASERMSRLSTTPVECDLCGRMCSNIASLATHKKCTHNLDPEYREALSKRNSEVWSDPEYKARMSAGSRERATTPAMCPVCSKVCGNKPALGYHVKVAHSESAPLNHTVISVEKISCKCEVYDLTVGVYHNFALSSGVFVHNCADFCAMSEERGNTPHEWFEKNLGVRWRFTPEQVDQIRRFLDVGWEE